MGDKVEIDMDAWAAFQAYWRKINHANVIGNIAPETYGLHEFWGGHGSKLQCYATTKADEDWNDAIENGYAFGFHAGLYFALNFPELIKSNSKIEASQ